MDYSFWLLAIGFWLSLKFPFYDAGEQGYAPSFGNDFGQKVAERVEDDLPFEKNYYIGPERKESYNTDMESTGRSHDDLLCWFVQGEDFRVARPKKPCLAIRAHTSVLVAIAPGVANVTEMPEFFNSSRKLFENAWTYALDAG